MERIRETRRIKGRRIVLREARLSDAAAIRNLFERIYKGKYPLEFGTNVDVLRSEISDPDHAMWLVCQDAADRSLVGAILFLCDPRNRMCKAGGGVVLPEYRHYGLGTTLLKRGLRFMTRESRLADVIYGTTRTVSEGPSKMVAESGFHKMGIFPNAVQIEELEHLNLDVYLTGRALRLRRKTPYLYAPFASIYDIARRQLGLEKAHVVTQRDPLKLSKKKLALKYEADPARAAELFGRYSEQKRISNSFFPFHKPNAVLSTEDGGADVFLWNGGVGKQTMILGFRSDYGSHHDLLDSVALTIQRSGASYVELLVDAYDYVIQQEAYTAKYIPSAYFPAMRLAGDGLRDDYFVVSRTFQIVDFTSSYVTQENLPYLKSYMRSYNALYIEPLKRSDVRRKDAR
jgi:RimJ/RimL family protein N-acetyltransferase